MKALHLGPALCLLGLSLAACSNDPAGAGADLAVAEDLSVPAPDLTMAPADLKQLTCAQVIQCVLTCRTGGGMNCEQTCAANASLDAQLKVAAVAACLVQACPTSGANAPCASMSSQACSTCALGALLGACRTQAQACGL